MANDWNQLDAAPRAAEGGNMRGVYIKGIEMPESCQKCPFLDYEEGFCFASGVKGNNGWYEFTFCPGGIKGGRHDDCPLIPVPPHGRLIDADAEVEVWDVCGRQGVFPHFTTTVSKFLLGHLVGKIPPAIIPADEKGET